MVGVIMASRVSLVKRIVVSVSHAVMDDAVAERHAVPVPWTVVHAPIVAMGDVITVRHVTPVVRTVGSANLPSTAVTVNAIMAKTVPLVP